MHNKMISVPERVEHSFWDDVADFFGFGESHSEKVSGPIRNESHVASTNLTTPVSVPGAESEIVSQDVRIDDVSPRAFISFEDSLPKEPARIAMSDALTLLTPIAANPMVMEKTPDQLRLTHHTSHQLRLAHHNLPVELKMIPSAELMKLPPEQLEIANKMLMKVSVLYKNEGYNLITQTGILEALEKLQNEIRERTGNKNYHLDIISGYRDRAYNSNVKGAKDSQHMHGSAADVALPPGMSIQDFFQMVQRIPEFEHGGIGLYPEKSFIHMDVRSGQARWTGSSG